MLVNIEDMSAEELFELANKKKRNEEQAAKRAAAMERVGELRKQREQLMRDYEQALTANDKAMQALQKEREQLITKHQAAVAVIDKSLSDLESAEPAAERASTPAPVPAPAKQAAAGKAAQSPAPAPIPAGVTKAVDLEPPYDKTVQIQINPPQEKPERDEMGEAILEIIAGRPSISESMLKEQLRNRGIATADMGKALERMVREGKLSNRGYGNFALAKKR